MCGAGSGLFNSPIGLHTRVHFRGAKGGPAVRHARNASGEP